ncbi:MAG: DNA primase, partial [Alphaproteobacteria bacterium]|nr:DNA primase [Alphaproteobacteria bacterium]
MQSDLQKFLDELRSRLSVADVVGEKVKLVRKGREYIGLCPFHNEKTPSFTVNEAKGFYHCFGCGAHGDIIRFEMEANGLPFMDAVEKLAHKAGLTLPKFSKENSLEHQKRQSLFEIMELAVAFYEKQLRLPVGAKGLEYFYHRGLDDALIKKFRLGYAPSSNNLKAYLKSEGVNEFDMSELGLIVTPQEGDKTTRDFFKDRVMIPIFDKQNRPIAFGGRIMGDGQPKYLNSPETTLFNKRQMLYNYNFARDAGYAAKRLVICEGYMDVIALDKFGFSYAAAPMGTALTEEQIMQAWKVVSEPVLCFDGDAAGIKAAIRSID